MLNSTNVPPRADAAPEDVAIAVAEKPKRPTKEEFVSLAKAANGGDEGARSQLRRVLDSYPDIWRTVGDLDNHCRAAVIRALSRSWLSAEAIERTMAQMKQDLAGTNPSALEKMLVEQVVLCWAFLRHAEINALEAAGNISERRQRDRVVDQAHRRYLESIKALSGLTGLSDAKSTVALTRSQLTSAETRAADPADSRGDGSDNQVESAVGHLKESSEQSRDSKYERGYNAEVERAA